MKWKSKKIINDPVYGFVSLADGVIFDLIEHPYFQRLRRIQQLGLTHYVYPGAVHTRFHHAIGAYHLMRQAIDVLKTKGIDISEEEATGLLSAILLHDIGHGPFSHALEHVLVGVPHEVLSLMFMDKLNSILGGRLHTAIEIFKNTYSKGFLHQLISGQLDMDRMDYLSRDSYFTGVHEGVIGYDRIIKMLSVKGDRLVVEEKGLYSVEKFLLARKFMYWQVYLHQAVLSAEKMLVKVIERAKHLVRAGFKLPIEHNLAFFLENEFTSEDFDSNPELLERYAQLDDYDLFMAIKQFVHVDDSVLSFLSKSIMNRNLLKTEIHNTSVASDQIEKFRQIIGKQFEWSASEVEYVVFTGTETNSAYSTSTDEIQILKKDGQVEPMSTFDELGVQNHLITKHYLCYPRII